MAVAAQRSPFVHKKSLWIVVIAGATALLAASCKTGPKISGDTAAIVNQSEIKISQVDKVFHNRIKQTSQNPVLEEASTLKLNILSQLIMDQILMERAAKDNLTATETEVNAKFTDFKKDYTEEKFQQFLKDQGVSVDDIKKELVKNATIEKLYNKEITSKISVTESEISDYFNKNRSSFNLPERWHVLHILVTPWADPQINNSKNDDAKTNEEARQKVQNILRRILGGEDFATVARAYSEDSSTAPIGGDLRLLSAEQLDALDPKSAFVKAVQSLKPGETLPSVVVTKYGYHIIKLLEKEAGGQHELSDPKVQSDVRQLVFGRKESLLKAAFLEVVRNEATVRNVLAEKILVEAGK
jgi:peptidyl-prolyl cis-trans isomerase SurA